MTLLDDQQPERYQKVIPLSQKWFFSLLWLVFALGCFWWSYQVIYEQLIVYPLVSCGQFVPSYFVYELLLVGGWAIGIAHTIRTGNRNLVQQLSALLYLVVGFWVLEMMYTTVLCCANEEQVAALPTLVAYGLATEFYFRYAFGSLIVLGISWRYHNGVKTQPLQQPIRHQALLLLAMVLPLIFNQVAGYAFFSFLF